MRTLLFLGLSLHGTAHANAQVGGYVRVMARPDLQGGTGRLGHWNLYGRLLNEGPYAALDLDVDVLEPIAGTTEPWAQVHTRIEGGSVGGTDPGNGNLSHYRLSQLHIDAGQILANHVTWRVGTLESTMADLGLYDFRPAQVFHETVGLSGRYQIENLDVLLGVGDSGNHLRQERYDPVLTAGGSVRLGLGDHAQLGGGGQWMVEPAIEGNVHAPYDTPGVGMEDWLRGEVIESFRAEHPIQADRFPGPEPRTAQSMHAFGYFGFGDLGPLTWNSLIVRYDQRHPEGPGQESHGDETHDIHVTSLTDERTVLLVGNEMLLSIIDERWDVAWGVVWGNHTDGDNDIAPSDHDRTYASTVLRTQVALQPTVSVLAESSVAQEWSRNGNRYREHADSIFSGTGGMADSRGLETGDSDTRNTWQGKIGVVLQPLGPGVFTRPSLRLLYGTQYSNENNAFSNHFVQRLDQYNEFGNVEQHWHHVIAMEAETWF